MQYILILLLLVPISVVAKPRASTLEEILECSHSVIYGKVIEGKVTSKTYKVGDEAFEDDIGEYKVLVKENIAGVKLNNETSFQIEFSDLMIGGMEYHYPSPGLEYIFILWNEEGGTEGSPYHLPLVTGSDKAKTVTGGQHAFLTGVSFYYFDQWKRKEGMLQSIWDGNEIHKHVEENEGYTYESYSKEIRKKFGTCNPDEE